MTVADLIGKPYSRTGEGPDAFNCWNLVRTGLLVGAGIVVPMLNMEGDPGWRAVELRAAMGRQWGQADRPQRWDILAMRGTQQDLHVGLFLDGFRVLHTSADAGEAMIQRLADFRLLGFGGFEVWRRKA